MFFPSLKLPRILIHILLFLNSAIPLPLQLSIHKITIKLTIPSYFTSLSIQTYPISINIANHKFSLFSYLRLTEDSIRLFKHICLFIKFQSLHLILIHIAEINSFDFPLNNIVLSV